MLFDHLIQIDEKFFVIVELKLLRVELVLLLLGLFLLLDRLMFFTLFNKEFLKFVDLCFAVGEILLQICILLLDLTEFLLATVILRCQDHRG